MEATSMSSLRSIVRPSISQPKPAWSNPAVLSAGVGLLKMKTNRLVVVSNKWIPPRHCNGKPTFPTPKIDLNGNLQFVIFVRSADHNQLKEWSPLMMVERSPTAKHILLDKKTTEDTIARELASVIYKDEKEIQKKAKLKYRVLHNAIKFRYGFKLVENGNIKAAAESINDVIELKEQRKSAWDKVRELFPRATNEAKESFGKLTSLGSIQTESES